MLITGLGENRTDNRGFGYDLDMKTTNFGF